MNLHVLRWLLSFSFFVVFSASADEKKGCEGISSKELARELLELELSGVRLPFDSVCLKKGAWRWVKPWPDPVMDGSVPLPSGVDFSHQPEILSVVSQGSLGVHEAKFKIGSIEGSFLFRIHSHPKLQKKEGCAVMIDPPKNWIVWKKCLESVELSE